MHIDLRHKLNRTHADYVSWLRYFIWDTTERLEGIAAGTLKLVGTDEEVIYENFKRLLEDESEYAKMSTANNPCGDSFACKRIADILEE